ncbi:MAG: matrixin family metalloprotease [Candidatus Gastranaerophilaceae bacterium]
MKKLFTILVVTIALLASYSISYAVAPQQNNRARTQQNQYKTVAPKYAKWQYPTAIKTYIPPNHKRTTMMKHAFAEWSLLTKNKIVFKYVQNPKTAQVVVSFVPTIPNADREIGLTKTKTIGDSIVFSEILIADKAASGHVLSNDNVYTVMLHEIGHAIGIFEHSNVPTSIMFPVEDDVQEISKSDLRTLADIYGW